MLIVDNLVTERHGLNSKAYHGINVQVIVDKRKVFLYQSIISRGAEHDSTAFKNSSLYTWLVNNWNFLKEKGYYFIDNSAYFIRSVLHTLHMITVLMEQQRIITTSSIRFHKSPSSVHSEKWF